MSATNNVEYTKIPMAEQVHREHSFEDETPFSGDMSDAGLLEKNGVHQVSPKRSFFPRLTTAFNIIVLLISIAMFEKSLQWQIQAERNCLNMHSMYCEFPKAI
jgi:hypothetical protein